MIQTYIEEFLAVTVYLKKHEEVRIKKDVLIAPKPLVDKVLSHNMYATVEQKLTVWRGLRWIQTEPDRFTKKVRDGSTLSRAIVIDLSVYDTLKTIKETSKCGGNKRENTC